MQDEWVTATANLIVVVLDKHIEDSRMMMKLSNLVCYIQSVDLIFGACSSFKVVTEIFDKLVSASKLSKMILQSSKIAIHATLNRAHQFYSTSSIIDCEATSRIQKAKVEFAEDSNHNNYNVSIMTSICRILRSIMEM